MRNRPLLAKSTLFLVALLVLLILQEPLNIRPEAAALGCAILALASSKIDPAEIFRRLDWETIFFLLGFFFIVGGLQEAGVLNYLSETLLQVSGGDPMLATVSTLWISGLASTAVSNIAVALTLPPVIQGVHMSHSINLWSALVLGTNLGGAATPMSGVVCILALNALKREGIRVSFGEFSKIGMLTTLTQLGFATLYLLLMVILGV